MDSSYKFVIPKFMGGDNLRGYLRGIKSYALSSGFSEAYPPPSELEEAHLDKIEFHDTDYDINDLNLEQQEIKARRKLFGILLHTVKGVPLSVLDGMPHTDGYRAVQHLTSLYSANEDAKALEHQLYRNFIQDPGENAELIIAKFREFQATFANIAVDISEQMLQDVHVAMNQFDALATLREVMRYEENDCDSALSRYELRIRQEKAESHKKTPAKANKTKVKKPKKLKAQMAKDGTGFKKERTKPQKQCTHCKATWHTVGQCDKLARQTQESIADIIKIPSVKVDVCVSVR